VVGTSKVGQQAHLRQLIYMHLCLLGLSRWLCNHSTSSIDGRVASLMAIDNGPLSAVGCSVSNIRGEK
jgi:hypothetical protein